LRSAAKALDRMLLAAESVLALALLAATVAITFAQVVCRYVLSSPLAWSQELATYSFVSLSFLGATMAVPLAGHYGIELLVRHFPPPLRRASRWLGVAVMLAFAVLLVVTGVPFALDAVDRSASMGVRMAPFYAVVPIAGMLIAIHVIAAEIARDSAAG
jgi:TRAP-type C4-dicarboxylate transport system permease small subunit